MTTPIDDLQIQWSAGGQDGHTSDGYRVHIGPGGYTQRLHVRVHPPAGWMIALTCGAHASLSEARREAERMIAEARAERTKGRAA